MKATKDQLLKDIEECRNTLQTERLDMSFGEIMSMYEKDEIIINPEFQRLYRWTDFQKTRFFESLLVFQFLRFLWQKMIQANGSLWMVCSDYQQYYHFLEN